MKNALFAALMLGAAAMPSAAGAQQSTINQTITGTRLDISATGDVARVPDLATISAGVVSRAATATSAIQQTAARMGRVREALRRAGIADRDIQTSNISLNPDYVYASNQPPKLSGYSASNQLTVRFHDIASTGKILDALVEQGANQISGPNLSIEHPEAALDEARAKAVAVGRARADLFARAVGMRVARIVSISESGGYAPPPPMPPMVMMAERSQAASSKIDPGEQKLQISVSMTFELQ
ncbi:SIMPL domain-containing protein [Sphingomonas sp.]|uniref:SIMPL domain-containing protein n=1 Tax=Sphingomonas sp. TaxID=28214 RepID=UPI0038A031B7